MEEMYFQEPSTDPSSSDAACVCCGSAKRHSPSSSSVQPNPKREKPISPLYPGGVFSRVPLPAEFPPLPLRRCTSDPVPLLPVVADVATPSPERAAPRGLSRAVSAPEKDLVASIGESPESKRLKRMKEKMKEMSKWCDQVIAEGDEEDEDEGEYHLVGADVVNNEASKDDENEVGKSEGEEAVSVEKNGECLTIHMKCPCSKSYQFLISGNNCYYKIM